MIARNAKYGVDASYSSQRARDRTGSRGDRATTSSMSRVLPMPGLAADLDDRSRPGRGPRRSASRSVASSASRPTSGDAAVVRRP